MTSRESCKWHVFLGTMFAIMGQFAVAASPDPNAQHLYWASYKINRVNLDGSGAVAISDAGIGSSGLLVDRASNSIYVTDGTRLRRFNLDGSGEQTVWNFPRTFYNGETALDSVHNQFYVSDSQYDSIWRVNRDGTNPVELLHFPNVPGQLPLIDDVDLDLVHNKLYWTSWPSSGGVDFRRANLDGTSVETLFHFSDRVGDFALDVPGGKVYWTEFGSFQGQGGVFRSNLNGSNQQTLASGLWGTTGIALDLPRGKMYFADHWSAGPTNYDGRILVSNLDGSNQQTFLNLGPLDANSPYWLSLDPLFVPEPPTLSVAGSGAVVVLLAALFARRDRLSAVYAVRRV
jgi:hypothetical protein